MTGTIAIAIAAAAIVAAVITVAAFASRKKKPSDSTRRVSNPPRSVSSYEITNLHPSAKKPPRR